MSTVGAGFERGQLPNGADLPLPGLGDPLACVNEQVGQFCDPLRLPVDKGLVNGIKYRVCTLQEWQQLLRPAHRSERVQSAWIAVEPAKATGTDGAHRPVNAAVKFTKARQGGEVVRQTDFSRKLVRGFAGVQAAQGLGEHMIDGFAIVCECFAYQFTADKRPGVTG